MADGRSIIKDEHDESLSQEYVQSVVENDRLWEDEKEKIKNSKN